MPYKITFDLPNLSKGQGVAVPGLGEFKNGGSYTISDEQHDQYRILNARQVDAENGTATNELGPTLIQTKFTQAGITVEQVKSKDEGDGK